MNANPARRRPARRAVRPAGPTGAGPLDVRVGTPGPTGSPETAQDTNPKDTAPHDSGPEGTPPQGTAPQDSSLQDSSVEPTTARHPRASDAPLVPNRSKDDSALGWNDSDDANDERLRRDVPPHWA